MTSDLFNEEQAAEYLGITLRTLREWRKVKNVPYVRLSGKVIRYRKVDIDLWLSRRVIGATAGGVR